MRRADRLFQIVQFLRSRRLTTAQWLAERLGDRETKAIPVPAHIEHRSWSPK